MTCLTMTAISKWSLVEINFLTESFLIGCYTAVETNGSSDSKVVKITGFTKSEIRKLRSVTKRSFWNFKSEGFLADLSHESWFDVFMNNDANEAAELLRKKINTVLDKHPPLKTFQVFWN